MLLWDYYFLTNTPSPLPCKPKEISNQWNNNKNKTWWKTCHPTQPAFFPLKTDQICKHLFKKQIIFSLQSIKNAVTNNLFGKENSKFKFFFVYEGTLWMATVTSPSDLTRRLLKKRGNENAKFSWLVPILSLVVTVVNICWKWGQSIFVDQSFHSWDIYLWLNSDIVRRIQCWSLLRL